MEAEVRVKLVKLRWNAMPFIVMRKLNPVTSYKT